MGPTLKDKHIKSSQSNTVSNISQAHHTTPEATGLLRAKKTAKKTMKKARATNTDQLMALLCNSNQQHSPIRS
jgi:hypothetical protein